MNLTTKFDVHQYVWFMHDNKVTAGIVEKVTVEADGTFNKDGGYRTKEIYSLTHVGDRNDYYAGPPKYPVMGPEKLFSSKLALLDTL